MLVDCDLYRQQHRTLLAVVATLRAGIGSLSSPGGHSEFRRVLTELAGKLTVHLQMEDRSLFPELLECGDAEVRATALRFQERMGSLRAAADLFFRRWLGPDSIEGAPTLFSVELSSLLEALSARVAAEEVELFPLADQRGRRDP